MGISFKFVLNNRIHVFVIVNVSTNHVNPWRMRYAHIDADSESAWRVQAREGWHVNFTRGHA